MRRGRCYRAVLGASRPHAGKHGVTRFQHRAKDHRIIKSGYSHHIERRMAQIKLGQIANHRRHLVSGVERLLHSMAANAASRAEDSYPHSMPLHLDRSRCLSPAQRLRVARHSVFI